MNAEQWLRSMNPTSHLASLEALLHSCNNLDSQSHVNPTLFLSHLFLSFHPPASLVSNNFNVFPSTLKVDTYSAEYHIPVSLPTQTPKKFLPLTQGIFVFFSVSLHSCTSLLNHPKASIIPHRL